MVQRSLALAAPLPLPSPTPADALGAVLRHLHRSGGFPPGTLLLVGPMVTFVSFLDKRAGIRVLESGELSHVGAFMRAERWIVEPSAKDLRLASVHLFLDTCLEVGLRIDSSARSTS